MAVRGSYGRRSSLDRIAGGPDCIPAYFRGAEEVRSRWEQRGRKTEKMGGNAIPPSEEETNLHFIEHHGLPGGTSGIRFIGTGTVFVLSGGPICRVTSNDGLVSSRTGWARGAQRRKRSKADW